MKFISRFKNLGPGILFAAAAIGVSHLVQSTKAGAEYGLGLLWAIIIVHIIKYPFFKFGPQFAAATGKSLLDGFADLGRWALYGYFIINFITMFIIQAAVTLVTAGLCQYLFGWSEDIFVWSLIVMFFASLILIIGRYHFLDKLMKWIVILLTITTIFTVLKSGFSYGMAIDMNPIMPSDTAGFVFLIALMGWMPAPLDLTIWQSLWTVEKLKENTNYDDKKAVLDFNVGYSFTIILAICFLLLGLFVMYGSGTSFSPSAIMFSKQLIELYSTSLNNIGVVLIGIAVLTTMFSTSLTTYDASARAMTRTIKLINPKLNKNHYLFWLGLLFVGTLILIKFFISEMGLMVKVATVFSFLTAPLFAILILILIKSKFAPDAIRPSRIMTVYSYISIVVLILFSIVFLTTL